MCEVRHLEASHRSVPYNCLGIFYSICKDFLCLCSDIHSFPSVRNLTTFYDLDVAVVGEVITDSVIYRKKKFYTFLLCFLHHIESILKVIILAEGCSDMSAHSLGECIGHTTTDDQCIYLVKKVVDNRDLAGNLSTAKDCYEWSLRIVYSVSEEIDLFLHQISYNCCLHIFGNTYVGAVSSVSSSECIIYEYIAERSKFFAELVFVLCLFCTVTCVLKKNYIAIFHLCYSSFCVRSYYLRICCKFYFLAKKLRKTNCYRCKRKLRFRLSLRFSKVGAEDNFSAVCDQFLDCRKSSYKTVLICDLSILKRNVEVASYKYFLSFYIDIVNTFFVQHLYISLTFISAKADE